MRPPAEDFTPLPLSPPPLLPPLLRLRAEVTLAQGLAWEARGAPPPPPALPPDALRLASESCATPVTVGTPSVSPLPVGWRLEGVLPTLLPPSAPRAAHGPLAEGEAEAGPPEE